AQLLSLRGGAEAVDRRDPELLPDPPRRLRAEPGEPHGRRPLDGHDRLALRERVHLAVARDLNDLLLDRPADPLQLLRAALERELRDRARRLADLGCRAAVGADPEPVLALELHQVGEEVELRCEVGVPRQGLVHRPMIFPPDLPPLRATICLPTYNERDNLRAMLEALGAVLRDGDRVLVIDDNSPDGTGALADRLATELGYVGVLH